MVHWCSVFGEFLMATHTLKLAEWASQLVSADLPQTVNRRCRLQLLHVISQAQLFDRSANLRAAGPKRGPAKLVGGGSSNAVTAARAHAESAASGDQLDYLLGGSTGVGAVSAALACAKGRTFGDVLCAIAAANEVAGRVGASMTLGPHHGAGNGWVHTVSAATAAAKVMGLDKHKMAHAIAIALMSGAPIARSLLASEHRAVAIGLAVGRGVEAALLAKGGVRGQLDLLESPGGLLELGCWLSLHHAFTGLGTAWLTETVAFPRWPGPPAWHAALDGVDEILERHVKAADKRLRSDQIIDITIRLPAPAVVLDHWVVRHGRPDSAGAAHSLRHAVGSLVAQHELKLPLPLEDERCGVVASKVRVEHDLGLTMDLMGHVLDTALPLFGGITEGEWRGLMGRLSGPDSAWPQVSWRDIRKIAEHRPDKWAQRVRYAPRDLSEGRLSDWQWRLGASVEIRTIRGGKWPVTRPFPTGGPGNAWEPLVERVVAAFAQGDESSEADAFALVEMDAGADSSQVMNHLLG